MKFVERFLWVVFWVLMLVPMALLAFHFSDQQTRRGWLLGLVHSIPGVELEVGDDFYWGLGSEVTLRLREARLKLAGPNGQPQTLQARMLDLSFPVMPVLRGRLELDVKAADVQGNLQPGGLSQASYEDESWLTYYPGNIDITNLHIGLQNGERQDVLDIKELLFLHEAGAMKLALQGGFNDLPLLLESKLGPSGSDLEIRGRMARVKISAAGKVDFLEDASWPWVDLDISMNAPDLDVFGKEKNGILSALGPASLDARLQGRDVWKLADIRFQVDNDDLHLDARGDIDDVVSLEGARLSWTLTSSHFEAQGLTRLSLVQGKLDARGVVSRKGGPWVLESLTASLEGDQARWRAQGEIADLQALGGLHFQLNLDIDSLASMNGNHFPMEQPVSLETVLESLPGKDALSLKSRMQGKGWRMKAQGEVGMQRPYRLPELVLELEADELSRIGQLFGVELQPLRPVRARTRLALQNDRLELTDLDMVVGESDLQGELTVFLDSKGTRGKTSGQLHSRLLDISAMLPERKTKELKVLKNAQVEKVIHTESGKAKHIFSRTPLSFDWLKTVNTQLEWTVDDFKDVNVELKQVKIPLRVQAGVLKSGGFAAIAGDSPVKGDLLLDASVDPLRYKFNISASNIDVAKAFSSVRLPPGSTYMQVSADVQGTGNSVAAMMRNMNGEILLGLKNYPVGSGLPERLGESVLVTINPAKGKNKNILQCGAVYFSVKDGIAATPRGIAAVFEQATWLGEGKLDLKTESIWLSLKPLPRKGLGIRILGLSNLVMLGGSLASPTILIDPQGAVETGLSYAAAVSTGGATLLLEGLMNKARANEDVCAQILRGEKPVSTGINLPGPSLPEEIDPASDILDQD